GGPVRVEPVGGLGDARIANLRAGAHALKIKCDPGAELTEGATVHVAFAPTAAHLFSRLDGTRLTAVQAVQAAPAVPAVPDQPA
ncbi:MAG: hypothetical protein ACKO5J_02260, partial [Rubrivivax sp.]